MVRFTSSQVGEVLQRLYNSEIDINLSSEFNEGFSIGISAHPKADKFNLDGPKTNSIVNVIDGIAFAAAMHYPKSDFAAWYKGLAAAPSSDVSENTPQTA